MDIVQRLREMPYPVHVAADDEIEKLRDKHSEAMTHLTNALNENQRLKREMWMFGHRNMRLRRAAGDVCDAMERWEKCQDGACLVQMIRNAEAPVRALSDAIGREPR